MNSLPMPSNVEIYNASGTMCDTLEGPCCCGAWHTAEEIALKLREAGFDVQSFQLREWAIPLPVRPKIELCLSK